VAASRTAFVRHLFFVHDSEAQEILRGKFGFSSLENKIRSAKLCSGPEYSRNYASICGRLETNGANPRETLQRRAATTPQQAILKMGRWKTRLLAALRQFCRRDSTGTLSRLLVVAHSILICRLRCRFGRFQSRADDCYEVVRDEPDELIEYNLRIQVRRPEFYRLRELDPERLSAVARAARLIYLNKTCYNGLYRVNKQGKFNTPFGRHSNVKLWTLQTYARRAIA